MSLGILISTSNMNSKRGMLYVCMLLTFIYLAQDSYQQIMQINKYLCTTMQIKSAVILMRKIIFGRDTKKVGRQINR